MLTRNLFTVIFTALQCGFLCTLSEVPYPKMLRSTILVILHHSHSIFFDQILLFSATAILKVSSLMYISRAIRIAFPFYCMSPLSMFSQKSFFHFELKHNKGFHCSNILPCLCAPHISPLPIMAA